MTADLQAVNQDLHLRVASVATSPSGAGVRVQRVVAGGAEGGGAQPEAAEPPPVALTAEQLFAPIDLDALPDVGRSLFEDESNRNHYFTKLEILPGNVGYMDYDQFGFPNSSKATADAAFAYLAEVDALIIDLRNNRGGVEGMNQYLASHFFGEEPVHLYSRYYGYSRTTLEYMTFPDFVERRFPDLPLYILVNDGTGSAAENFSFSLQGLGRATIVGEATTPGAAHSSRAFDVQPGLALQLPVARAFNPRTDEDWEGEGVIPDLAVESSAALAAAHAAAVDGLIAGASAEKRLALEDAKLLLSAAEIDPAELDLAAYEGQYGSRRVYVEDEGLKMMRTDVQGVPPVDLVPLAADYFTLRQANVARIRFERNDAGEVVRIHVRLPTGAWETGERG
jgi:hypothetical protein